MQTPPASCFGSPLPPGGLASGRWLDEGVGEQPAPIVATLLRHPVEAMQIRRIPGEAKAVALSQGDLSGQPHGEACIASTGGDDTVGSQVLDSDHLRSEEHTSELHHVAISYAVFC